MPHYATIVVTVRLPEDKDATSVGDLVELAVTDAGAEIVGCDWIADGDTIADQIDLAPDDRYELVDLNPTRWQIRNRPNSYTAVVREVRVPEGEDA
jgi:hypothetical protein